MTHPSTLTLSMLADGALSEDESTTVQAHVDTCGQCSDALQGLQAESRLIAHAMQANESLSGAEHAAIPKFKRPLTLRGFALANLGTGLIIWAAQFLWKTVFGELVMNATVWATSIFLPDVYALASATTLYLLEEGTAMFDAYLGLIVLTLSIAAVAWAALRYGKHWRHNSSAMAALLLFAVGLTAIPTSIQALEIRRGDSVITITSAETIDDSLILIGETIFVEGTVTGDVIAVGQRVEVSGRVQGNLLSFAETVTVSGSVAGMAIGGASNYDLRNANIGGDLWVGGEVTNIDAGSTVSSNVTMAARVISVDGAVGKDLNAFSENAEIRGSVGADVEAFVNRLRLLGEANIAGNVNIRSDNPDVLYRDDTVVIGGELQLLDMPEELENRSRYATVEFYLWQIVWLISAFIVGVLLLWLVPALRRLDIGAGMDAVKSAGIGFLTLVSVPVAAVLVAVTLVGLPVSLIAFFGWLVALYLAKILVGVAIGGMVMDVEEVDWRALLVGLAIVLVGTNVPFIGGFISFILMMVGLGLLVRFVIDSVSGRETSAAY